MCISPVHIHKNGQEYDVPCGKCIDCVNHRASDWRQRCLLECKTTDMVFFVTMTIDEDNMPKTCGLAHPSKRMIQLFHKRLRITIARAHKNLTFKYFLASEYGPQTKNADKHKSEYKRPHYHALYFVNGSDARLFPYFFSKCWKYGFSFISLARSKERSASYIVKYISSFGQNPYFGEKLSVGDYVKSCDVDNRFTPKDFNTFCLHSISLGSEYFKKKLVPRYRKNLTEVVDFLRDNNVPVAKILRKVLASDFQDFDNVRRFYDIFKDYESILFHLPISKEYSFSCPTRTFSEYVSPIYHVLRNSYRHAAFLVSINDMDSTQLRVLAEWKAAQTAKLREFYKTFDKKRLRNDMQYLASLYSN